MLTLINVISCHAETYFTPLYIEGNIAGRGGLVRPNLDPSIHSFLSLHGRKIVPCDYRLGTGGSGTAQDGAGKDQQSAGIGLHPNI